MAPTRWGIAGPGRMAAGIVNDFRAAGNAELVAVGSRSAAEAAKTAQGGELGNFDAALRTAYLSMASDTGMIRKKRAERRQHTGQAGPGQ